jgi:hypothetical protein
MTKQDAIVRASIGGGSATASVRIDCNVDIALVGASLTFFLEVGVNCNLVICLTDFTDDIYFDYSANSLINANNTGNGETQYTLPAGDYCIAYLYNGKNWIFSASKLGKDV